MTIEEIELRKILTQMLADNGINRETIADMTREIISEKVDKSVSNVVNHQTNMDYLIQRSCREMTEKYVKSEAYCHAKDAFKDAKVTVDVKYTGLTINNKSEIENKLIEIKALLDAPNCDINACKVLLSNLTTECLTLIRQSE